MSESDISPIRSNGKRTKALLTDSDSDSELDTTTDSFLSTTTSSDSFLKITTTTSKRKNVIIESESESESELESESSDDNVQRTKRRNQNKFESESEPESEFESENDSDSIIGNKKPPRSIARTDSESSFEPEPRKSISVTIKKRSTTLKTSTLSSDKFSDSEFEPESNLDTTYDSSATKRNNNKKRKNFVTESETDSSDESIRPRKRRLVQNVLKSESENDSGSDSDADSDSDSIIGMRSFRNKPVRNILSDSVSDSSGSSFGPNPRINSNVEMNVSFCSEFGWESDWVSDSEPEPEPGSESKFKSNGGGNKKRNDVIGMGESSGCMSSDGDSNSDRCPICLLSFNKKQEVGTPETCDHSFCAECILEWAKNVNTCPVDRQTFALILVRKCLNGKVIRSVPVDDRRDPVNELFQEDPTFCQICGLSDREDRLLLCDGCNLGYHLECLDPPLDTVPIDEWFCAPCNENLFRTHNVRVDIRENSVVIRTTEETRRLLPRTRQIERVRARIETNRNASSFGSEGVPGTSRQNKRRRRKRKRTVRKRYRTNAIGETVPVTKRCKRKRQRRKGKHKRKRKIVVSAPRTVKKRLAYQLGMCPPKKLGLAIPEVKVKPNNSNSIGFQRSQAGIPTLHLFGQRNELDYFSGGDEVETEFEENYNVVVGNGSVSILNPVRNCSTERRIMRRKAALHVPDVVAPVSSCDILGSILDSQTKLHSKCSTISIDRNGSIHIENKSEETNKNNNNNNFIIKPDNNKLQQETQAIDLTTISVNTETKQTPMFPGHGGGNRYAYNFQRGGGSGPNIYGRYDNSGGAGSGGGAGNYNCYQHSGRGRSGNYYGGGGGNSGNGGGGGYYNPPPFRGRGARFQQRRPQQQHQQPPPLMSQPLLMSSPPMELMFDETVPPPLFRTQSEESTQLQPQEDVDIYSDIETNVNIEDEPERLPPPPLLAPLIPHSFHTERESDNSDTELVIDDTAKDLDKYDPAEPSGETDQSNSEPEEEIRTESALETRLGLEFESSSVSEVVTTQPVINFPVQMKLTGKPVRTENKLTNFPTQILTQAVRQLTTTNEYPENVEEPEVEDDETCPNFSIYSSESFDIAKTSDSDLNIPIPMEPEPEPEPETLPEQKDEISEGEVDEEENEEDEEDETEPEIKNKEPNEEMIKSDDVPLEQNEDSISINATEIESTTPPLPPVPVLVPEKIKIAFDPNRKTDLNRLEAERKEKVLQLYDDSDWEEWGESKTDPPKPEPELDKITTESISEEERSYTPCLDEREPVRDSGTGIGGLDTELISDEERNEFDETQEVKTVSDGDALEINAKESELELARPEDYEEGEIVEKKKLQTKKEDAEEEKKKRVKKKAEDKENETVKKPEFKKLSKNNKERNYRDKEKGRSKSKEKEKKNKEIIRDKKKEKKKDLERYNVRNLIADKPKKDQFGRDINRSESRSTTTGSPLPRSLSRSRRRRRSKSFSRSPRRSGSYRRSRSRSRSRSPRPKKHRDRSPSPGSRERYRNRRHSTEKRTGKKKKQTNRSRSASKTRSPILKRSRDWERRFSRDWTPSWSRSPVPHHTLPQSPSWTPPLILDKVPVVQSENLTVILNNDVKTKKKEKKKKTDKKSKDEFRKRKRDRDRDRDRDRERTPPPSKEVFASGDNILVSVSFNKTTPATDDGTQITKRKKDSIETGKKNKKDKLINKEKKKRAKSPKTKRRNKEIANMKPVAIIDLDLSPFKELTPSPKDIIVLSDSDHCEKEMEEDTNVQEEEEEEEEGINSVQNQTEDSQSYLNTSTGPKTPPEPQIKFLLPKQTQLRAISNPLHDPNDDAPDIDPEEELEHRLEDMLQHKGPNTPPEPPTSSPSSPDAYDPFDPTKSRSPTPEPQTNEEPVMDKNESDPDLVDLAVGPLESNQKTNQDSIGEILNASPESKSPVPVPDPVVESMELKPKSKPEPEIKSPERNPIGVVINQQVQPSQPQQQPAVVKPIITTAVTPIITTSVPLQRNTFTTTQRIILPTSTKSSPAKLSPSKPPIKSTPIKPMLTAKTMISKLPVPNVKPLTPIRKQQQPSQQQQQQSKMTRNGNEVLDMELDLESPYSPGSSDYEDLFEPPVDLTKKQPQQQQKTKSPAKQNVFDSLFGSSPVYRSQNNNNNNNSKTKTKTNSGKASFKTNKKVTPTKAPNKTQVGVKIDEDNLKILDDLPNSAVEMQVKDKFLKKLNRQERVVEEVKLVLKPHYNKKHITKDQYKDILRRAVPKICHNRSGEINPKKIQNLVEAYVRKERHIKKSLAVGVNAPGTGTQQKQPKTTLWS